jgi:hypothetical protein
VLWHRIAYDWGMPVRELQERITSAEFTDLCAYLLVEPRGYAMENWRAGMIAATVANVAPRKKGAKPLKPQDFYPSTKKRSTLSERQLKELRERRQNGKRRNSNG